MIKNLLIIFYLFFMLSLLCINLQTDLFRSVKTRHSIVERTITLLHSLLNEIQFVPNVKLLLRSSISKLIIFMIGQTAFRHKLFAYSSIIVHNTLLTYAKEITNLMKQY